MLEQHVSVAVINMKCVALCEGVGTVCVKVCLPQSFT